MVRGRAWLWTGHGGDPLELAAGDLALVRGGPDHFIGHEPGARCVLPGEFRSLPADDAAPPPVDELDRTCLDRIARFKRPRDYRFVEALPTNNYGKVVKRELRIQADDGEP